MATPGSPQPAHAVPISTLIRELLSGGSPNGVPPAACAPYTETVSALYDAHAQAGTPGVRSVFIALSRQRPELLKLVAEDAAAALTTARRRHFRPLSLTELLNMPPKQWLIDQVIGAGDIAMLYGPPGTGKTFVIIDLIFAACLGQTFANRFGTARPLSIAYCAGEGISGLPQRFAAAAAHYGTAQLPDFRFFDTVPQLFAEDRTLTPDSPTIEQFIQEWQEDQILGRAPALDILIIDTLNSAAVGADENSAKDMGKVLAAAKLATKTLGCAVILLHHTNRAGTGERGSSALRGAMDTMIEVKTTGDKFVLTCEKIKDGEKWKPQPYSLVAMAQSVRVWWDDPSEVAVIQQAPSTKLVDIINDQPEMQFTSRQLAEAMGMSRAATINLLTRLVDKGEIMRKLHLSEKPPSNRNPWVYFKKTTAEPGNSTANTNGSAPPAADDRFVRFQRQVLRANTDDEAADHSHPPDDG